MLRSALSRVVRWPAQRLAKQGAALSARGLRASRRLASTPGVVAAALGTHAGVTPHEMCLDLGGVTLRRYRCARPARYAPPVLLCYALVNRPYILDLQAGKSVVQQYLDGGFDVYLLDWGSPSYADRVLTLEDYVGRFLAGAVDFILREHECQTLHLLGYCMGGTMAALLAATRPEQVETLTLLAAPIDFSGRESLLNVWADRSHFDVDAFVDTFGNCPGAFLQGCFLYTKPIQNLVEKALGFYDKMDDARFVQNYFAVERWANDNIPVAGETFRQFVKKLYQANELVLGEFHLGRQRVDLERIRCPLLLLTAQADHLVAPASTLAIREHVGSSDMQALSIEAGHVGLVVSSAAHRTLWPAAVRWLGERSTGARRSEAGHPQSALTAG
jgi:poly[(R)-3-hydroxyalkanoate] polymerase subunit PhaC